MNPGLRREFRAIVLRPLIAWGALLFLLGSTVGFAYVPMGRMNLVVALAIAGAKAAVIATVFMELVKARPVHRLAAIVGVFWLAFLFVLIFSDYLTRAR